MEPDRGWHCFVGTILYVVPRTSVLGAIVLTGYLGGAVATHIRAGEGWRTTVPAFVFGALVWLGLLLRDRRLRELLPLTNA
ncbi:MAG: DoxX family protein [Planctomycetaceae bacterium]